MSTQTEETMMPRTRPSRAPKMQPGQVLTALRDRIAMHEIAPGARIKEQEVADEFGISRAFVREVFGGLACLGFVDRYPNRGVVVRRLDVKTILQLFDARQVNEGLCARLAAQTVKPESWDDLVQLFAEPMEQAVAEGDLETYVQGYTLLRRRLTAAANNPVLATILDRLYDATRVFARRILLVSDRRQHGLEDHRAVIAALRRGDADGADRMRQNTIANVKAAFERYHRFIL